MSCQVTDKRSFSGCGNQYPHPHPPFYPHRGVTYGNRLGVELARGRESGVGGEKVDRSMGHAMAEVGVRGEKKQIHIPQMAIVQNGEALQEGVV